MWSGFRVLRGGIVRSLAALFGCGFVFWCAVPAFGADEDFVYRYDISGKRLEYGNSIVVVAGNHAQEVQQLSAVHWTGVIQWAGEDKVRVGAKGIRYASAGRAPSNPADCWILLRMDGAGSVELLEDVRYEGPHGQEKGDEPVLSAALLEMTLDMAMPPYAGATWVALPAWHG